MRTTEQPIRFTATEVTVLPLDGDLSRLRGDAAPPRPGTLAANVRGSGPLSHVLNSILTASDLDDALGRRAQLAAGECLVTPDGLRVGRGWVSVQRGADAGAGVLAREQEIRELGQRQEVLVPRLEQLAGQLADDRQALLEAEQAREEFRAVGGGRPVQAALGFHWARLIELLYCTEAIRDLLDDDEISGDQLVERGDMQPRGIGVIEAPRGTLSHWIVIENGKIKNYQAVVPSTWNAGPRDDKGRPGPYEASLIGNPIADPERPLEVLRTVHSMDPCIACAVHVIDPANDKDYTIRVY